MVVLLYVVHEKRLADASLSFSGVWSVGFFTTGSCGGVLTRWGAGMSLAKLCSWITVSGESVRCWEVGDNGLGYVWIPRPLGYVGETGEANPRGGVFLPTLRGTVGLMRSSCESRLRGLPATEPVSAPPTPRLRETASELDACA